MSCKNGDSVSIRHNNLRDPTAKMSYEVCRDTEIEPKLTPLTGEDPDSRTANAINEARFDIRARGVWERKQHLDLRVFDPNNCRFFNKLLQQCPVMNKKEKKRAYNERVFQIEHGAFTPLVF